MVIEADTIQKCFDGWLIRNISGGFLVWVLG
jgi:hypothetical protein